MTRTHRITCALALLALSLPTPTLSAPLPVSRFVDALWDEEPSSDTDPQTFEADRPWPGHHDLHEDALDVRPGLRWRQRNAYGRLPAPGYTDDGGPGIGYGFGTGRGYGYGETPARAEGYGYGYRPGRRYPLAVIPSTPQPPRRCGAGQALVGAAIGGGLGAALSDGSRQRQWALPIGATVGGLLAGVLAGC